VNGSGGSQRGLKAAGQGVRLPVVCTIPTPSSSRRSERPATQLSDLRESGAIEQDADVIAFIHRSKEQVDQGTAELIIANSATAPVGTVDLVFLAKYTRFESRARQGAS